MLFQTVGTSIFVPLYFTIAVARGKNIHVPVTIHIGRVHTVGRIGRRIYIFVNETSSRNSGTDSKLPGIIILNDFIGNCHSNHFTRLIFDRRCKYPFILSVA